MAGRLLVGQAGGATAVINRSLAGVVDEARATEGIDAIWGMRRGVEGALQEDFVDLGSLPAASLACLSATPGAALGSTRHHLTDDEAERLLHILDRRDIRYLIYIGGNDSADTLHRLAALAADRGQSLAAILVPKTIDNDLPETDHSPGYGSIARYIAIATMDSAKDTESMPAMYPVKFIEVMGRDAGWVAAAATLGKQSRIDPPHLIYVPERPVSREQLLSDVERVHRDHGFVVAVVTETLRDERGTPFADPAASTEVDAFGHPLLRGTADTLCKLVQRKLGLRSRFDKPGSLQRMSMLTASPVDLQEAGTVGREAVRLAAAGQSDRMVTIVRDSDRPYSWHADSAPLNLIANRQRLLPQQYVSVDGRGTTEEFARYAMPLMGAAPLPDYFRLDPALAPSVSAP